MSELKNKKNFQLSFFIIIKKKKKKKTNEIFVTMNK